MTSAHIDPCLYYRKENGKLAGVTRLVTDDTANTGTQQFATAESKATSGFITNKHEIVENKEFRFFGQQVTLTSDGLVVRQYAHIEELKLMDSTASEVEQEEFRSQRGKILYITQTSQPQVAYAAARLSQVNRTMLSLKMLWH